MNKKTSIIILSIVGIAIICIFIGKCWKKRVIKDNDNNQFYIVTFDTDGGSIVSSQKIKKGSCVLEPITPLKDGFKFVEWRYNNEKYDFSKKVTKNISLKAIWEKSKKKFTVEFELEGKKQILQVADGARIDKEKLMFEERENNIIEWRLNGKIFDIEKEIITNDILLLGKYIKEKITVTYHTNGGNTINNTVVKINEKIKKPKNPTRDGYTFVNWYIDKECTRVFDFENNITEDITLYAKWSSEFYYSSLKKAIQDVNSNKISNSDSTIQNAYVSVDLKSNNGPVIKLLKSIDINENILLNENMNLDLNSNNLSFTLDDSKYKRAIEISNNKNVNLKNGIINIIFNNRDGTASNPVKEEYMYAIYGMANITGVSINAVSQKAMHGIYPTGTVSIRNSNINFKTVYDGVVAIQSEYDLYIENSAIKAISEATNKKYTQVFGIINTNYLEIKNSSIVVDSKSNNQTDSTPRKMTSCGIQSDDGRVLLYNTNLTTTDFGVLVKNGTNLYVNGGSYQTIGHGGFYLSNYLGENYLENVKITSLSFDEYHGIATELYPGARSVMYIGGSSVKEKGVRVYLNNCILDDHTGTNGYFVLRGTSGEQNIKLYVSNTKFLHSQAEKFRIDHVTDYVYFGSGNTINSSNLSNISVTYNNGATSNNIIFTNEVYKK